jgi:NADPH:quinone reductase-like Zn-dependent oxidoreductase
MVRSIGADNVIDYTKEDFARNGKKYDVIFDTVRKISASTCQGSLTNGGVFISSRTPTDEDDNDLIILIGLLEEGKLKAVIDKRYPLEKTAEAHRYVDKGHKRGNVVINII